MRENRLRRHRTVCLILLLVAPVLTHAGQLNDFRSDGCSLFPDGTPFRQDLWCDCCMAHDLAYWQGGTRQQKRQADQALRRCVAEKTGSTVLADAMYFGVRLGGSPVFPTWYRWGYGWRYGRGFRSLNGYEQKQIEEKIRHYQQDRSLSYCDIQPLTDWL